MACSYCKHKRGLFGNPGHNRATCPLKHRDEHIAGLEERIRELETELDEFRGPSER